MVALTSFALMGAGCVSTGSKSITTPKGSAAVSSTVEVKTPSVDNTAMAAACSESGGTFMASAASCFCQAGYTFDNKTNQCLSADGTPGGTRGVAMRDSLSKAITCRESGGTYDDAKGWCLCPAGRDFKDGRCIADVGAPAVGGQAVSTATTAPEAKVVTEQKDLQEQCDKDAMTYQNQFVKALQKPIPNRYTDFVMKAHYNPKEKKCYALIDYKPKDGTAASNQLLIESDYESIGDVAAVSELAHCTSYINASSGSKSTECYVGGSHFTTSIYDDYLRQTMEIIR